MPNIKSEPIKGLVILTFLLSSQCLFCQNQQLVDSLLSILPTENDSLNSLVYAKLRGEYLYVDIEKSKIYLDKEVEYANQSNNPDLITNATYHIGIYYTTIGDFENGSKSFDKTMAMINYDKEGIKAAKVLHGISMIYCSQSYFEQGIEKLIEGLKIMEKTDPDNPFIANFHMGLGNVHGTLANYELSNDYYEKAKEIFIKENDKEFENFIRMMMGINNLETGKTDIAKKEFERVLTYFEDVNSDYDVAHTLSNLGNALQQQDSFDKAEVHYLRGLSIANKLGFESIKSEMYQRLGDVNMDQNDYNSAIKYLLLAQPKEIEAENIRGQARISDFLSICYSQTNRHELAYKNLRDYIILNDSILSEERISAINEIEVKYQTEKKEQEIKLLEEKAKRNSLEKKGMIGGIIGLLSLFGALIYAMRQRLKKNKLEKEKVDQELTFSQKELEFSQKELDYKKQELTAYALQLAHKNNVLEDIKYNVSEAKDEKDNNRSLQKVINKISFNQNDDDAWEGFRSRFQSIHKDFESDVLDKFPKVSPNELRLMALLKMNFNSKEIANILNISSEGIKKARYRLRKKLGMEKSDSLEELVFSM